MPRLPDKTVLGNAPTVDSRGVAMLDVPKEYGASMNAVAGQVAAGVGKLADAVIERKDKEDAYAVQKLVTDFDLEQEKRLDDAKRATDPEAKDFTAKYRAGYDKAATDMMRQVPWSMKEKVDQILVDRGAKFEKRAYDFEWSERDRFNIGRVNTDTSDLTHDSMSNPHRAYDNALRGVSLIRSSRMTQRAKIEAEKSFLDINSRYAVESMARNAAADGRWDEYEEIRSRLRRMPRGTMPAGSQESLGAGPAFSPQINAAIDKAATDEGVDAGTLRTFAKIESGGDPRNRTGSYKGLFQLSDDEYAKHGGKAGSIYDANENARAYARKLKAETSEFQEKYGRAPTPAELYLVHQQGAAGAAAHMEQPNRPAWQSMMSTGEGKQKGERWAKQAIWGNIPDDEKVRFGSVEKVTSGDFAKLWADKVGRFGGGSKRADAGTSYPVVDDTPRAEVADPTKLVKEEKRPTVGIDPETGQPVASTDIGRTQSDLPTEKPSPHAESGMTLVEDTETRAPSIFDHLTPRARHALERSLREGGRVHFEQPVKDDAARLKRGLGEVRGPDGRTALDRYRSFATPMQYQKAAKEIADARRWRDAIVPLRFMTPEQREEHISKIASPTGNPNDIDAAGVAIQKEAQKRAEAIEKALDTNSAAVVEGKALDETDIGQAPLPNTLRAHAEIAQRAGRIKKDVATGPDGQPVAVPPSPLLQQMQKPLTKREANEMLIEARKADLAVIDPDRPERWRIITKDEAAALLKKAGKGKPEDYEGTLEAAKKLAVENYGKYAYDVLKTAFDFHLHDEGNKHKRAEILQSLFTGAPINRADYDRARLVDEIDNRSLGGMLGRITRTEREPERGGLARGYGMVGMDTIGRPAVDPYGMDRPEISGRPGIAYAASRPPGWDDSQRLSASAGRQPVVRDVSPRHADWLRKNPDKGQVIDEAYGPGAAARVLAPTTDKWREDVTERSKKKPSEHLDSARWSKRQAR